MTDLADWRVEEGIKSGPVDALGFREDKAL